ncbi:MULTISPECIES: T9SS type A sorting domain-containing protein [Flavobacterium]|uniref:T9SS type A sorting domain-containing protein n=1 Tax=Flavobacterium jumunjinense TaxID=998845 RepID=A0ABV5GLE1_9FLAO|nr:MULTISPECIES: T9SS type A sorting domain-containing protein [Flavobacterium]
MRKLIYINILFYLVFNSIFAQDKAIVEPTFSPNGYFEKVFDNYENSYQLKDLLVGAKTKVGQETTSSELITCDSGFFDLYFETGSGMEDETNSSHNARRAVVCKVFKDISNFINSPLKNNGNTTKVKIWIRNISNINGVPSNAAGLATSFYTMISNTTIGGIIDNEIWKTIQSGKDSYKFTALPIRSTTESINGPINFYHGLVALRFDGINWNIDLNSNAQNQQQDLYTVVLHEVTHALGFNSLLNTNGTSLLGNSYKYFSRYDTFLKDHTQNYSLITNDNMCGSMYNYSFNTNLSNTVFSPNTLDCNNPNTNCNTSIFFSGINTTPVYTPNCFRPSSSLSHFEDLCTSPSHAANSYFVMSKSSSTGSNSYYTKRYLKPEERNALIDIGYSLNLVYGDNSTVQNSYYDYGGTIDNGNNVVGFNDGITEDGIYNYIVYTNEFISINNILANDYNAIGFECLEVINDASATIFPTFGDSSTSVSFKSLNSGLRLLRYIPINSEGEKGNITYIYVYIYDNNECATNTPNDLVKNGKFNQYSSTPNNLGQIARACGWQNISIATYSTSPDYFNALALPQTGVSIPCNKLGYEDDIQNTEKAYAGMLIIEKSGLGNQFETIKTKLDTPLQANTTYQLSFDVSLAENVSTNVVKFQAFLSNTNIVMNDEGSIPIPLNQLNMLFTNPTFTTVTNGWERISFIIPSRPVAGEEYLYLGGLYNVDFLRKPPVSLVNNCNGYNFNGPGFSANGWSYYYIDNVSLIVKDEVELDLPNELCTNEILHNLDNFVILNPFNGTFSGNGVGYNNGVFSFNSSIAGLGNHTITFTYQLNGTTYTLTDIINVTNTNAISPLFDNIQPICSGENIDPLPTTSLNGITGSWSPSLNNTISTTYLFTPFANQCATSSTLTIEVLPANDPSCNSNPCLPNLTLSTIENNSTIIYKRANWIEANASYVVDVNKNVTMKAGDYIVFNTDSHLKAGSEVTALIEVCTPTSKNSNIETIEKVILEEAILNESIVLFPNPTSDRLTIASDNVAMNSVIITAMDGKIIYTNNSVNNSKLELNTSSFQAGVYIVNITTKNGTGFIKKLVKN